LAETIESNLHQGVARRRLGYVSGHDGNALAGWVDLTRGRVELGCIATVDDDRPALTDETDGNFLADS